MIIPATNDPDVEGPPNWPLLSSTEVTVNLMVIQQFGRVQLRAPAGVTRRAGITIVDAGLLNEGVVDMANNPGEAELNFAYNSEISGRGEITFLNTTGNHITPICVEPGFTVSMVDGHTIRGNGHIIAGDPTLGGGFINNGDILAEKRADGNLGPLTLTGSGFVNNKRIAVVFVLIDGFHGQLAQLCDRPAVVRYLTNQFSIHRRRREEVPAGIADLSD